jgi:hypothetical protein
MKYLFVIIAISLTFSSPTLARRGGNSPEQTVDYMIPTQDSRLEKFAHFTFRIEWKSLTAGNRKFEYDIPEELDGLGQEILLTETTPNKFEGLNATATCVSGSTFRCTMKYKDLRFEPTAAKNKIDAIYSDPVVRAGKLEVMNSFRLDPEPGGVLVSVGEIEN